VVVVADAGQHRLVEGVGAAGAGVGGVVVGFEQGVGHRERPQLGVRVGVGDRPQIPEQMSTAPGVHGREVGVAGVAVADEDQR